MPKAKVAGMKCIWCGHEAFLADEVTFSGRHEFWVQCDHDECQVGGPRLLTEADAIKAWNRIARIITRAAFLSEAFNAKS